MLSPTLHAFCSSEERGTLVSLRVSRNTEEEDDSNQRNQQTALLQKTTSVASLDRLPPSSAKLKKNRLLTSHALAVRVSFVRKELSQLLSSGHSRSLMAFAHLLGCSFMYWKLEVATRSEIRRSPEGKQTQRSPECAASTESGNWVGMLYENRNKEHSLIKEVMFRVLHIWEHSQVAELLYLQPT